MVTSCGLVGPDIEFRWRRGFPHLSRTVLGTGSYGEVKLPGRVVDRPLPSNAEVKESVQLYIYSPTGSSWPAIGRALPLLYLTHIILSSVAIKNSESQVLSCHCCTHDSRISFTDRRKLNIIKIWINPVGQCSRRHLRILGL